MDNLLNTLVDYASAGCSRTEDPITEVLAWLLRADQELRLAFLGALVQRADREGRGRRLMAQGSFEVETQVVMCRARGLGVCRPDLVLSNRVAGEKVLVEIKVHADLTPTAHGGRTQLDDYLDIAEAQGNAIVYVLAPRRMVISGATNRPCFGGQVRWQSVYDAFRDVLARRKVDGVAALHVQQFLELMERKKMAVPPLSFEGALAVRAYTKFRDSLRACVDAVVSDLDPALTAGFGERSKWAEGRHGRMGYSLKTVNGGGFAFMGVYHGDEPGSDELPELYFFLEVPRGSPAQEALDEEAGALKTAIAKLNEGPGLIRYGYDLGGWETLWAVQGLSHVIAAADQPRAIGDFFTAALTAMRPEVIARFLNAAAAPER